MAKTWKQKLDNGRAPKVEKTVKDFCGIPAGSQLLISTPREVDGFVRKVREGRSLTAAEMRAKLAARHGADAACPISTGNFLRISAEAAWDEIEGGKDPGEVTPFWRVIEPESPLARKLRCGPAFLAKMRAQEGIAAPPQVRR